MSTPSNMASTFFSVRASKSLRGGSFRGGPLFGAPRCCAGGFTRRAQSAGLPDVRVVASVEGFGGATSGSFALRASGGTPPGFTRHIADSALICAWRTRFSCAMVSTVALAARGGGVSAAFGFFVEATGAAESANGSSEPSPSASAAAPSAGAAMVGCPLARRAPIVRSHAPSIAARHTSSSAGRTACASTSWCCCCSIAP
mmetsp:Transcript_26994/g.83568  ORF Transcript_26994/g.83568 Transcript_26994/m.83568 type:complete len:201 (-) Transcript_26994:1695-2297(-)